MATLREALIMAFLEGGDCVWTARALDVELTPESVTQAAEFYVDRALTFFVGIDPRSLPADDEPIERAARAIFEEQEGHRRSMDAGRSRRVWEQAWMDQFLARRFARAAYEALKLSAAHNPPTNGGQH